VEDGHPRELTAWQKTQPPSPITMAAAGAFTTDDRYVLSAGVTHPNSSIESEGEWFVIPVDGGDAKPTGAGPALRAAGLKFAAPVLVYGGSRSGVERVFFAAGKTERTNIWEIRLSPGSLRVRGEPRQLTFGTEIQQPGSIAAGMLALDVSKAASDL